MTAPLCNCGCGEVVERRSYETDNQWRRREKLGIFRDKCRKNLKPRPSPNHIADTGRMVFDPTAWSLGAVEGKEQPKELTPRDPAYLDWLRTFDCVECGWPAHMGNIEAHHVRTGGMAIKGSDYESAPLCGPNARGCHAKADKTPTSVEKYLPWALRFNALWIAAGNKIKKGGR